MTESKEAHVEPNRSRKRKQFTLSNKTREHLDYLKNYFGTSESNVVDMAIAHYYAHVIKEVEPLDKN